MHCPISNQIVKTEFWLYIVNFYKNIALFQILKMSAITISMYLTAKGKVQQYM